MDKETAVEQQKIKGDVNALEARIEAIEVELAAWKTLVKSAVIKAVKYLIGLGLAGLAFGWNLPENTRKALIRMLSE